MAINISAWSIRHPLPPLVMAAAIVALGYISFSKLPVTRMPNVDVPVISVTVTQFGAPPAESRVAGHEGRRGCRLRGCWCPSYQLGHHRWDIPHDHPFPLGNGYGSRTQ